MKSKLAGCRAGACYGEKDAAGGKTGFTLIELLVVIAVIAILAAMLLPALNKGRVAAHNATCRSNLHQMSVGLSLYVNDFHCYVPNQTYQAPAWWFETLKPYVGASWPWVQYGNGLSPNPPTGVYVCPSYSTVPGAYYDGVIRNFPSLPSVVGAYGYNSDGVVRSVSGSESVAWGLGGFGSWQPAARETQVIKPTDMIAFGDSSFIPGKILFIPTNYWFGVATLDDGLLDLALRPSQPGDSGSVKSRRSAYARRHSGQFNIVFCDGHSEHGRPDLFFDSRQESVLMRWNYDNQAHKESTSGWVLY